MTVLYFSSTGNSLYIAKRIGGKLISIPEYMHKEVFYIEDSEVGIVFPVYDTALEKIFLNEETEARYALAVCYLALIEEVEKYVRYEPDDPTYIRNTIDSRDMYHMAFDILE